MKKFYGILLVIAVLLVAAAYAYSYTNEAKAVSSTDMVLAMPYVDAGSVSAPEGSDKKAGCGFGNCDKSAKNSGDYKGKCGTKNRDASKSGGKNKGADKIVESA